MEAGSDGWEYDYVRRRNYKRESLAMGTMDLKHRSVLRSVLQNIRFGFCFSIFISALSDRGEGFASINILMYLPTHTRSPF